MVIFRTVFVLVVCGVSYGIEFSDSADSKNCTKDADCSENALCTRFKCICPLDKPYKLLLGRCFTDEEAEEYLRSLPDKERRVLMRNFYEKLKTEPEISARVDVRVEMQKYAAVDVELRAKTNSVKSRVHIGASCDAHKDCLGVPQSTCQNGKCLCPFGFFSPTITGCVLIAIGTECSCDAFCGKVIEGATCSSTKYVCQCPSEDHLVYQLAPGHLACMLESELAAHPLGHHLKSGKGRFPSFHLANGRKKLAELLKHHYEQLHRDL